MRAPMRRVYCVSYDLKSDDNADYTGLYEVLKSSKHWWHYLESTWLVVVDATAEQLWTRLTPHIQDGDRVLVIGVTSDSQGALPPKAWDWITRNIDSAEAATR
jgi:hypothetical protein